MARPNATPISSDSPSAAPAEEFLRITSHIPDAVIDQVGEQPGCAEPDSAITPEMVKAALRPTFNTAFHVVGSVRKRTDVWALKEFENKALVEGWTPIVQKLLAKLGSETEILLALAIGPTIAVVMGKFAQEAATRPASSTASTKTPESAESSSSSASEDREKQPEPSDWSTAHDD